MTPSGKHGQLGMEILFVVIVLFVVGFGLVFVYPAFQDLNVDLQADEEFSLEAKAVAQETVGNYPSVMDNMYVFLFGLLWMFMIGISFFSDTHPFFMVFTIILVVFCLVASMILSNAYTDMKADEDFSVSSAQFPKLNWILENILVLGIIMSLSSMMVLYGKVRG